MVLSDVTVAGEALCSSSSSAVQSRGANGRVRKGWVIIRPPSRTLSFSVGEVWCAADAKRSADQYHGQLALISIEHVIDVVCACGDSAPGVGVEKIEHMMCFRCPPRPATRKQQTALSAAAQGQAAVSGQRGQRSHIVWQEMTRIPSSIGGVCFPGDSSLFFFRRPNFSGT